MDTIIARQDNITHSARGRITQLHFHQGMVLLVGGDAVALYRDITAVDDPLANGLIGYEALPLELAPTWHDDSGFVREHQSGYVGLHGGAVLFIRPDGIALYASGQDALRNINCHWLIPFPALNA